MNPHASEPLLPDDFRPLPPEAQPLRHYDHLESEVLKIEGVLRFLHGDSRNIIELSLPAGRSVDEGMFTRMRDIVPRLRSLGISPFNVIFTSPWDIYPLRIKPDGTLIFVTVWEFWIEAMRAVFQERVEGLIPAEPQDRFLEKSVYSIFWNEGRQGAEESEAA